MPDQPGTVRLSATHYARIAGLAYLVIIATGIYAEFGVRSRIIVPGDAVTTASNITLFEPLFRSALISEFMMLACDVLVAVALYNLFEPVNRGLSLLAAFFRLVHASVVAGNLLNLYVPLLLLSTPHSLTSFSVEQRQELSLVFLSAHAYGYVIGLVFFAFQCFVIGYLILVSSVVPRVLGALLLLAGAGYLLDGAARTVWMDYASYETAFALIVFAPAFVGELSFGLWLAIKGGGARRD